MCTNCPSFKSESLAATCLPLKSSISISADNCSEISKLIPLSAGNDCRSIRSEAIRLDRRMASSTHDSESKIGSQCGEKVGPFHSAFLLLLLGKLTHAVQFRLPIFTLFKLVWRRALGPEVQRSLHGIQNAAPDANKFACWSFRLGDNLRCLGRRRKSMWWRTSHRDRATSGHSKSTFFPELPLCFRGVTL